MFLTIVIFALVLSVIVLVHECGHFLTARSFGVRAEEFGLGFPPRAIGTYLNKKGKRFWIFGNKSVEGLETSTNEEIHPADNATVYSINWLPIGGFVKIKGENGEGQNETDSLAAKKIWQRVIIMAAGVIMNVALAWALFSVGYMIGMPQSVDEVGKNAIVTESSVTVSSVLKNSPAEISGLKAGDSILKINGETVSTAVSLQDAVAKYNGQETKVLVKRDGRTQTILVTPTIQGGARATMGVEIYASGLIRYPFFSALIEGAKTSYWMIIEIFKAFGTLIGSIFVGKSVLNQFAGPVGIAKITGQAARLGFTYLLQFVALLSLNLAVINILPFPALDGGRILFLIIEKIKGKPIKREIENAINNIGFYLLIALVVFITYKDIVKLF
jgi:regulator of sigma E protease